jgi:hypothetical protein
VLRDSYGNVEKDEKTGLRFKYLRDGTNSTSNIVGKVFYDKKVIVIDDPEVNAALNFSSNRNWTYPEPIVNVASTLGNHDTGCTYYFTYKTLDGSGPKNDSTSWGYTGIQPLHCQYIKSITPSLSGSQFSIQENDTPWKTNTVSACTGVNIQNILVIIGTGSTTSTHADDNSWYYSAMNITTMSTAVNLPNYTGFVAAGNRYGFSTTNDGFDNPDSPFGSSYLGFAYMSGNFESTIYKMVATCVAKNNEFNSTQNETFNSSTNESVYITS